MTILVTGFEPFGGEKINPALEAVMQLRDTYEGHHVIKATLPVVFHKSLDVLDRLIEEVSPEIIICVGQAGGRTQISIERIGINLDDARIPDNENQTPIDQAVRTSGPDAYFSNLPIKAITAAIQSQGIPASVSNTAGTYVCNHVLYGLMDLIAQKYPLKKGGFIHVPYATEQVTLTPTLASMNLKDITRALEIAIVTAAKYDVDIAVSGGTTC